MTESSQFKSGLPSLFDGTDAEDKFQILKAHFKKVIGYERHKKKHPGYQYESDESRDADRSSPADPGQVSFSSYPCRKGVDYLPRHIRCFIRYGLVHSGKRQLTRNQQGGLYKFGFSCGSSLPHSTTTTNTTGYSTQSTLCPSQSPQSIPEPVKEVPCQMDGKRNGRQEVLDFLSTCYPPMDHLLQPFIDVGLVNREYLDSISVWKTEELHHTLRSIDIGDGARMSRMDILILSKHFTDYFSKTPSGRWIMRRGSN